MGAQGRGLPLCQEPSTRLPGTFTKVPRLLHRRKTPRAFRSQRISANDVARISLVKALTALAEFDEALPLIQDYARQKPADLEAHYLLGAVYRGLGQYAAAELELKRAVAWNPNHYDVHYNLGFVLARQGKPQEALPHLKKALELHPDSSEARFQLAGVLRALQVDLLR